MLPNRSLSWCAMALCAATPAFAAQSAPAREAVKLNEIQVIGTHNSYHAGIAPSADHHKSPCRDRGPPVARRAVPRG